VRRPDLRSIFQDRADIATEGAFEISSIFGVKATRYESRFAVGFFDSGKYVVGKG
jgi:hypothetical protein